jgi:hypothetical protein
MLVRMYRPSRRAAVVASLGILTISLLALRPALRHLRLSRLFTGSTSIDAPAFTDSASPRFELQAAPAGAATTAGPVHKAAAPFAAAPVAREAGLQGTSDLGIADDAIGSAVDVSRMLVRSGGATIEVSSIDSAIPRVRALAASVGGFIANSSVEAGRDQIKTAMLEVKAPAPDFDRLIAGLTPLGKVESVNVSAEDVGEEYVDIEARVDNDHRLEARLIDLLATRTGKLRDVLDVEQQLARVREEIERYDGRLRYLRAHAELSTLSITVHEPEPIIDHVGPNPLADAARRAWRNFIGLLAFAIASLGILLPLGAIAGGLWWMFRPARARVAGVTPTPSTGP